MLIIENKKELALSLMELATDAKIPHGISGFDTMAPKLNKGGYIYDLGNPRIDLNIISTSREKNLAYLEVFLSAIEKSAGPESYIGLIWDNDQYGVRILSHYKWAPGFFDALRNSRGPVVFNCTTKQAEVL